MVLMAIDHVRVYSGLPPGGPTPGIFFTRWITHFVAPAFLFLAGTSAFLHGQKLGDRRALSRFLLTRGLFLVLLELTVIRVAWTFNFDFAHYLLAGVIWMIGWCMVLMAGLVFRPTTAIAAFGLVIIFGHNIADFFTTGLISMVRGSSVAWLWQILYVGGSIDVGPKGPPLVVLFVIVPWIGVMAAGYAFGQVMLLPPERRRSICLRLGIAVTTAFVLLRALDVYGNPRHWRQAPAPPPSAAAAATAPSPARPQAPAALRFLNTSKYPASLLFLLMTLGPTLVLLGLAEGLHGKVVDILATFGRVPFLYYLLHIPAIHLVACVVSLIREGQVDPWLFTNHPMLNPLPPAGYTWSLPLLYVVWAIVVASLYVPCRWFATLKATRKSAWLSYI